MDHSCGLWHLRVVTVSLAAQGQLQSGKSVNAGWKVQVVVQSWNRRALIKKNNTVLLPLVLIFSNNCMREE